MIQVVRFEVLLGAEAVREGTEEWTDGVFVWQHNWDVLGTITVQTVMVSSSVQASACTPRCEKHRGTSCAGGVRTGRGSGHSMGWGAAL